MDAQLGRLVQAFEQQAPGPLAIVIAGCAGDPWTSSPNSPGRCDSSRCKADLISYRSVMMSYNSTRLDAAAANDAFKVSKSAAEITIGLSARTFNPASTQRRT